MYGRLVLLTLLLVTLWTQQEFTKHCLCFIAFHDQIRKKSYKASTYHLGFVRLADLTVRGQRWANLTCVHFLTTCSSTEYTEVYKTLNCCTNINLLCYTIDRNVIRKVYGNAGDWNFFSSSWRDEDSDLDSDWGIQTNAEWKTSSFRRHWENCK